MIYWRYNKKWNKKEKKNVLNDEVMRIKGVHVSLYSLSLDVLMLANVNLCS